MFTVDSRNVLRDESSIYIQINISEIYAFIHKQAKQED